MHWVDRGPEPEGLKAVRSRYITRWVEHYKHETEPRPSDSRWRNYHDHLGKVFFSLCAYCEEICRGEVEHFRPKSKFPELVYEWSNWVFACHACNMIKSEKWPPGGYVDPCAKSRMARPENFLDFDTVSGEIIPKAESSLARRRKAMQTLTDLQLNAYHHLKNRLFTLRVIVALLADGSVGEDELKIVSARNAPLSSIARVMLAQRGHTIAD